jgi:hypothetical protein
VVETLWGNIVKRICEREPVRDLVNVLKLQRLWRSSVIYGDMVVAWLVTIKVFLSLPGLAECELSYFCCVALLSISKVTVHKPAQCYISYNLPGWQSAVART